MLVPVPALFFVLLTENVWRSEHRSTLPTGQGTRFLSYMLQARAADLPCIEERFRQSNLPGTHEPNLLSRAPEVLSSIGSASDDGQIHLNSWVTSMGWGDIAYDENETL